MYDSQKISFQKWLLEYKNGVYIFSKDACQICHDYKKEIEYINNCNLYFVEINTDEEITILTKILDRKAFPITVCYLDNEIKQIKQGILYGDDWKNVYDFLITFPENPLTPEEKRIRIEKQKNRCILSYYILPNNISDEIRKKIINSAINYNEMPIDIDNFCTDLPDKERERMLEGNYHYAKMILWKDNNVNNSLHYTSFSQNILLGYTNANQEIKFITRKFEG